MKRCYFLILDGTGKTSKTAPWNWPKSWAKILRTTFAAQGSRRRHENGAFGTEIFRRIRQEGSRSPNPPPKTEKLKINFSKSNKIHHTLIIKLQCNKLLIIHQTKTCTLDFAKR